MYFENLDLVPFKIKLLNKAVFRDLVDSYDKITNLSKTERADLAAKYPQSSVELVGEEIDEESGTAKALFKLADGKKVETVLMRFKDGRNSVCVSTQVGCPVGCTFCASGQMGFMKNLTSHEIVDQVLYFARKLRQSSDDRENFPRVTNVVYMGMGEPMLNYANVMESVRILTNPDEFAMSPRRITMSSSGYVKQLREFMKEGLKTRLAISLHAPNQQLRAEIMPVAKAYSLDELFEVVDEWEKFTNKRVTYQYILISGINDSSEHALQLAELLRGRLAHVNLIPMNPIRERPDYKRSSNNKIHAFARLLKESGVEATIRVTMGDKIQAACGQLANKNDAVKRSNRNIG